MARVLGLDVGGANLKAAHSTGVARLRPFALWKEPAGLSRELHYLLQGLPPFAALAVMKPDWPVVRSVTRVVNPRRGSLIETRGQKQRTQISIPGNAMRARP